MKLLDANDIKNYFANNPANDADNPANNADNPANDADGTGNGSLAAVVLA